MTYDNPAAITYIVAVRVLVRKGIHGVIGLQHDIMPVRRFLRPVIALPADKHIRNKLPSPIIYVYASVLNKPLDYIRSGYLIFGNIRAVDIIRQLLYLRGNHLVSKRPVYAKQDSLAHQRLEVLFRLELYL